MKTTKKDQAIEAFGNGFNCAQSVVKTFAPELRIDEIQAVQMAIGFGAGMGRLQKTCGAVTGAFMVIGLRNSLAIQLEEDRNDQTNQMIQEFEKKFLENHGTTECSELLHCDLNTEEGQISFEQQQLGNKVCKQCILNAVGFLEEVF